MSDSTLATTEQLFWGSLELTPLQETLLREHLSSRHLKPGEVIWKEGEQSDTCMAFLVQGRLKAVKNNQFGSGRIVLGILEPGTVVGLPFVGHEDPKGVTLEALDEAELLTMCDGVFSHLLAEHLPLGIHLLQHIHRDFQKKMQFVAERLVRTF